MDTQSMAQEMLTTLGNLFRGPVRDVQDLTGGEAGILVFLMMQNGTAAPTEISRFFNITSARVTNALNSLEKKGYAFRQPVPEDRRRILVSVTESGRAMVMHRVDEILRDITRLLDSLGEEDAAEFLRLTKRVVRLCDEGVIQGPTAVPNTTGGSEE